MAWARFDDRYDDHPKIKRAWKRCPAAVGLHTMAVTYACRHELDGVVDSEWIEEKLPVRRERELVCSVLVECGLFEERAGGYTVHDFLDFNPSRSTLIERREKDRRRKESRGTPRGFQTDSERNPTGIHRDATGTHARPRAQAGTGRVEELTESDKGQQPQLTRELVDEACSILAAVERWQVDEVGIENAFATEPGGDLLRACHLAASWGSDSKWEMGPAASVRAALRKLVAEQPKLDEKTERKARRLQALQGLMSSTEGAA